MGGTRSSVWAWAWAIGVSGRHPTRLDFQAWMGEKHKLSMSMRIPGTVWGGYDTDTIPMDLVWREAGNVRMYTLLLLQLLPRLQSQEAKSKSLQEAPVFRRGECRIVQSVLNKEPYSV